MVNEALASGLPSVASTACGCTEDIVAAIDPRLTFPCGDIGALADALTYLREQPPSHERMRKVLAGHDFRRTVETVAALAGARGYGNEAGAS